MPAASTATLHASAPGAASAASTQRAALAAAHPFARSAASSSSPWLALVAIAAANALWGLSFLLGKIALAEIPPGHVVLWRFLIAFLVLLPAVWPMLRRLHGRDLPLLVVSGVLMVPIMMLVQFEGLDRTSATHAALILGALPILAAVGSAVFDRERVGALTWIAAAVSSAGLAAMVLTAASAPHDPDSASAQAKTSSAVGDLLVLASAVAAVAWTLVTRRLLRRYPSVGVTAASIGIGTLALLPITLIADGLPRLDVGAPALWSVLAMGVACTAVTYGLWNWGLRHVPISRAGILGNLEPLVGALAGIIILHEPAGLGVYVGGGFILLAAGIAAITTPSAAEHCGADAGALPPDSHDHPRRVAA